MAVTKQQAIYVKPEVPLQVSPARSEKEAVAQLEHYFDKVMLAGYRWREVHLVSFRTLNNLGYGYGSEVINSRMLAALQQMYNPDPIHPNWKINVYGPTGEEYIEFK